MRPTSTPAASTAALSEEPPIPVVEDRPAVAEPVACVHCGLAIPRLRRARRDPFCCEGCAAVHSLIRGAGLERYYELKRERTAPPPRRESPSWAWLERIANRDAGPDGLVRTQLDLQGIHCAACLWLLNELFARHGAGVELRINPSIGRAHVIWDPARGDLVEFAREAERFGYRFGPPTKSAAVGSRALLARLGICAAASMNVMIFSLSLYFGLEDGPIFELFGALSLVLATIAVAAGGPVFFRGAWQGLVRRVAHLDLPISIGMLLAWGGSVHAYFTAGPQAAYFDSVTIFVTLMLLGRWLAERVLERNRRSLLAHDDVAGLVTRRRRGEDIETVPAREIAAGDELWIVPGDLVPVEGTLLGDGATVSLDWIHGESRPQDLSPESSVLAGSFNAGSSAMRVRAGEAFSASRLHELLTILPGANVHEESPFWHAIVSRYVIAVLGLAGVAFLAWWPQGTARALAVTVSVLVVTCPCAIGLATPLAHDLVHAGLRRLGIFVRRGSVLERALRIRKILFDKTGTLTEGELALSEQSRSALRALDPRNRRVLGRLVESSRHPVSRSLARELNRLRAPEAGTGFPPAAEPGDGREQVTEQASMATSESQPWSQPVSEPTFREPVCEVAGHGLRGDTDRGTYRLGRPGFARGPSDPAAGGAGDLASRVVFTRDFEPLAELMLEETPRDDAASEIAALRQLGYEIRVLSGDASVRVRELAARVGIAEDLAEGDLDPEAKAARVRALDENDALMVGDGLNDGPSLDVAFCAATPAVDQAAVPARADFYFLGAGLDAVRVVLDSARRLRRVVRDNLVFAAVYNLAALTLCFAGVVTPVVAAILMPLSSLAVTGLTTIRLSGSFAAGEAPGSGREPAGPDTGTHCAADAARPTPGLASEGPPWK